MGKRGWVGLLVLVLAASCSGKSDGNDDDGHATGGTEAGSTAAGSTGVTGGAVTTGGAGMTAGSGAAPTGGSGGTGAPGEGGATGTGGTAGTAAAGGAGTGGSGNVPGTGGSSAAGVGGVSGSAGCRPISGAGTGASCNCTWGSGGGDPLPGPLNCQSVPLQPSATLESSEIVLRVGWCGTCGRALCVQTGTATALQAEVEGTWATIEEQGLGTDSNCSDFTARLVPEDDEPTGDVRITGSFAGADQCHQSLVCPVNLTYTLTRSGDQVVVTPKR
ncbi:MAG TPA: hypothetical protein VFZ53_01750 [Polyangiaceae bacterium]